VQQVSYRYAGLRALCSMLEVKRNLWFENVIPARTHTSCLPRELVPDAYTTRGPKLPGAPTFFAVVLLTAFGRRSRNPTYTYSSSECNATVSCVEQSRVTCGLESIGSAGHALSQYHRCSSEGMPNAECT
jgi:hypothetical protein